MVIGHSTHRAALLGILRKRDQAHHKDRRHDSRDHIQLIYKEAVEIIATKTRRHILDPARSTLRQAYFQGLDIGPPHQITHTFKEIREANGRHEQNDRLLADQMSENELLHGPSKGNHHT